MIYKLVSKDMGFPVQLRWKDPNVPLHRGGKGSTLLLQGKRRSGEIGKIHRLSLNFHSLDSVPGPGHDLHEFGLLFFFFSQQHLHRKNILKKL